MMLFPNNPGPEMMLRKFLGIFSIFILFTAVIILAMYIRQRRYRWLRAAVPLIGISYFLEQCFVMYLTGKYNNETVARIIDRFASLPDLLLIFFCLILTIGEMLMLYNIHRHKSESITGMSVKEAMDSLPEGICCYVPGGRVLLINHAMEEFSRQATGDDYLYSDTFVGTLLSGQLRDGCRTMKIGEDTVVVLPDGTAGKINIQNIPYEKYTVRMLVVNDITEAYRKMEQLQEVQRRVKLLEKRLADVNREIVSLTGERELLNAKIRIHDEMGSSLLAIKRFILKGGTDREKEELVDGLSRSVSFLRNDISAPARDEYDLMIETASRLGVSVLIDGTLPQTEPAKHIIATAIHECFTNTLRHAHGDELRVTIKETGKSIVAAFANNGEQPKQDIAEKGGLASLRTLTKQAGGEMLICRCPSFAIVLELPKEGYDVI